MLSVSERAPVYAWLSMLLAREIDQASWATLQQTALSRMLARVEPDLETWLRRPWQPALAEELAAEYARLFRLPNGVPPFASFWIEAAGEQERVEGTLTSLVSRSLEILGREPLHPDPGVKIPLDHAALLFDLVAAAAESSDPLDLEVAAELDAQALGAWLRPFGRAIRLRSTSPLYRALGRMLESLHVAPV